VTIYGPGAATPRERDEDGWVKWGQVTPWFKIENHEVDPIYDVTTGIERPSTRERLAFDVEFPSIPASTAQTVEVSHARFIPPDWLDGYSGESPHQQVRYWVRFLDRRRHSWELLHDARDLPPRVSRVR